jgi:hypothetical protein
MVPNKVYQLDALTDNTVNVLIKEYITVDGDTFQVGKPSRRTYSNNSMDRIELENHLPERYFNAIICVWGEEPTIADPVLLVDE